MASSFPFLLRVAAGLVSDTIDVVKRIPEEIPTLGVTLVGRAAKLSFELNQQLAALAVRGDHALSALSGGDEPPPERTAWSTIDDEDEVAANDPQAAARWDSVDEAVAETGVQESPVAAPPVRLPGTRGSKKSAAAETEAPGFPAADLSSSADLSGSADLGSSANLTSAGALQDQADTAVPAGYQQLTLAQLRGRLRSMSPEQLSAALTFEQLHQSRPAFLTLLSNRISTLAGH